MPTRPLVRNLTRGLNRLMTVPGFRRAVNVAVEYIRNGTFANGASEWNGGNSASLIPDSFNYKPTGLMRLVARTNTTPFMYQAITLTVGKQYTISVNLTEVPTSTSVRVGTSVGSSSIHESTASGPRNYVGTFTATSADVIVSILAYNLDPNVFIKLDDVSVKEVI